MFKLEALVTLGDKTVTYTASSEGDGVNTVMNALGCTFEEYETSNTKVTNINLDFNPNIMIEDLDYIQEIIEEIGIDSSESLYEFFSTYNELSSADFEEFQNNHLVIDGYDKMDAVMDYLSELSEIDFMDLPGVVYAAIDFDKALSLYEEEYTVVRSTKYSHEFIAREKKF